MFCFISWYGHFVKYVNVMAISSSLFLGPLLPRAAVDDILLKLSFPKKSSKNEIVALGLWMVGFLFNGKHKFFPHKKVYALNLCECSASYLGMGHFVKYVKVIAFPRSPSWGSFLPRAVVDDDHIIELELPREIFKDWHCFCRFQNMSHSYHILVEQSIFSFTSIKE